MKESKDIKERRKIIKHRIFNFKLANGKGKRKNVDDFIQLKFGPTRQPKHMPSINVIKSDKRKSINSYVYRLRLTFRFKRKTDI